MKTIRYWLNLLGMALLAVSLAVLFLASYVSNEWAKSLMHPARIPATGNLLKEREIPYQGVELKTRDGITLSAWYTPPQNGAVILVAHGYNDNRPESIYAMFAEQGYGVLAWDFRAHGSSGGEVATFGDNEQLDVEAALSFVLAQEDVEHVGAWGGSMGAATVILAAAHHSDLEAVVADSAYPTLEDVLRSNIPVGFLQPLVLFWSETHTGTKMDDVRPVDEIGKISPRAVFVIDGWDGGAIEMNAPYRLFEAAADPKEIWVEEGVPHLGMQAHNPRKYENKVVGFFDAYLLSNP